MELVVTEKGLNPRQKRFAEGYHSGPEQGNATEAYRKVYEVGGKVLSAATCASCASALLRDPRMIAYLKTLREAQAAKLQHTMQPFEDLAPEAQAVLVQCLRGECRSRMKYEAATLILDRALGRPVQRAETEWNLNPDGIISALRALSERRLLGDGRR